MMEGVTPTRPGRPQTPKAMKSKISQRAQDHLQKLLLHTQGRAKAIKPAERQRMEALGKLTPEDLEQTRQMGRDCLIRGQGFLDHDMVDDAIDELVQAVLLLEDDLDALHYLALSHQRRGSLHNTRRDHNEAARLARWCLSIDPKHERSFGILSQIGHPDLEKSGDKPPKAKLADDTTEPKTNRGFTVAIVLAVCVGALIGIWRINRMEAESADKGSYSATYAQDEDKDKTLDVAFDPPKEHRGLKLEVVRSKLNVYSKSAYYKLSGFIHNDGDTEVESVHLKLTLLGEDDEPLSTEIFKAPASHEPAIRPGDRAVIAQTLRTPPEALSARLEIQTVDQKSAGDYPSAPAVPLKWDVKRPEGVKLEVRQRSLSELVPGTRNEYFHDGVFEIHHTGTTAVTMLKVQIRYKNDNNKIVTTDYTYAVATDDPPIEPDTHRLMRTIESVPKEVTHFELAVIEVRTEP